MNPAQIIALVRDVLVVVGIGWLIFHIYRDGEDKVRRQDMEVVQKQLTANAAQQARWAQERTDAETKRDSDLRSVRDAIASNSRPVIVRVPSGGSAVSGHTAGAASCPAGSGGSDGTVGKDLRPAIREYEEWIEREFGDCRVVLSQWPR